MKLIIREFIIDDEKEVIELWVKCNLVKPRNNPHQDIIRKMKVGKELFLVGVFENKIIASVMAGYEGHRAWINYLAVDPGYQRKGFGREIMEKAEEELKLKGAPKINLQIRSNNAHVIEFYKSIGFTADDVLSMGRRLVNDY
jgi:ribosomal protein S18 acetylase RimI-like enzyme